MNELELIDFESKGNVIRLYLGKNGNQYGDDWNDIPCCKNCEHYYPLWIDRDKLIQDKKGVCMIWRTTVEPNVDGRKLTYPNDYCDEWEEDK